MSDESCPLRFGDLVPYEQLPACCKFCVANGRRTGNTSARTTVESGSVDDLTKHEGKIGMETARTFEHMGQLLRNVTHTVSFESPGARSAHQVTYEFECDRADSNG